MKIFSNIVIIALIGLFSSTYLFNLSPIDYRGTIEIETPEETSTLSLESIEQELLNPETITLNHISSKEEIIKSVSDSLFTLDVYQGSTLVKSSINNLEMVSPSVNMTISVSNDNPIITTLDISKEKLGLEDGTYKFVFNSNLISDLNKSQISVNVTYDTGGVYYPAVNAAPTNTKGLTLYFATQNADTLIPVTRFVVEDKSITRMAIEQLQNGPLNNGMISMVKDVTNTTYNNGNVVIDLPSSYTGYENGSTGALLSYEAFVKTIFSVDRYWPIYNITFTVDRKNVDTYFHGMSSEAVNRFPNTERNYLLYMAYKLNDRYYLFDYEIDTIKSGITAADPLELKAEKLFDAYKDVDINYGMSPLPDNVLLNNVKAQGTMLVLDFKKELLEAYKDRDDLKQMMIESLVYTFTTIPGVDSIKITINGENLKNLAAFTDGRDLTGALYPPEFINPEVVQEIKN
ncbi:MAG: GerMN domain-containing protein [Sedimentibacter sp.]